MNTLHQEEDWDLVIKPQKGWFDIDLSAIWKYRDLLMLFVRRDIVAFYKQTVLGPLWYFIAPIFSTIVYTFIFRDLAGLSTDGLPPTLFYLAGITAWGYFSACVLSTSTVLRDNASILGKVYFPRVIAPLSLVISNLFKLCIQTVLLVVVAVFFLLKGEVLNIGFQLLLFPYFIILMAMQGLGFGMIVSSLTTKYRDMSMLLGFGMQLLMFATPVVYPLSSLSGKVHLLISVNPTTYLIEGFRYTMLGSGTFSTFSLIYSTLCSLVILFFGFIVFNRVEKSFVDTI